MDASEVADALVDWVKATCPDIAGTYAHDPSGKDQPLPDVACFAQSEEVTNIDPSTGEALATGIEQADLHVVRATVLLMVEPLPADEAANALQGFVAALGASLKADQTLGGRVPSAAPRWRASYEPPFLKFDDGSEGRAAWLELTVAELT